MLAAVPNLEGVVSSPRLDFSHDRVANLRIQMSVHEGRLGRQDIIGSNSHSFRSFGISRRGTKLKVYESPKVQ